MPVHAGGGGGAGTSQVLSDRKEGGWVGGWPPQGIVDEVGEGMGRVTR